MIDEIKELFHTLFMPQVESLKGEIRALNSEIRRVEATLSAELRRVESKVDLRLEALEGKMETRLTAMEEKLEVRLTAMEKVMDARLGAMDVRIASLEERIRYFKPEPGNPN